jgi:hypothetical protein
VYEAGEGARRPPHELGIGIQRRSELGGDHEIARCKRISQPRSADPVEHRRSLVGARLAATRAAAAFDARRIGNPISMARRLLWPVMGIGLCLLMLALAGCGKGGGY